MLQLYIAQETYYSSYSGRSRGVNGETRRRARHPREYGDAAPPAAVMGQWRRKDALRRRGDGRDAWREEGLVSDSSISPAVRAISAPGTEVIVARVTLVSDSSILPAVAPGVDGMP